MKDLLDHLTLCHEQWQASGEEPEPFLAEAIRRDLDEMRRLCDSLHGQSAEMRRAAA